MQKTTLLSGLFIVLCGLTHAQMPDPGSKNFTFAFNPFSGTPVSPGAGHTGTLLFKYYKTSDLAFRFSGSINFSNSSNITDNGSVKTTTTSNYSAYGLGLGIQKNLATMDKFCVYTGADLAFGFGNNKYDRKTETYAINQPGPGGTIGDYNETLTTQKNPFNINLYPFLGLNYFLSKNFSVGAEFSMLFSYNFPGSGSTVTSSRASGKDYPAITSKTSSAAAFNLNPNGNYLVTASVYW